MEQITSVDELREYLQKNRIVIYGSGHVGRKFFQALKSCGLKQNIVCFAVSESLEDLTELEGIPVKRIQNLRDVDAIYVCVAVHEALKDEMFRVLEQLGIKKYVWIYPFLYEMLLGSPIKRNVKVKVDHILQTCRKDYRMAVRWLTMEQYFGNSDLGYELYVRAESLHCEKRTAQERLKKFLELIRCWEKTGYLIDSRIRINSGYEIIDGRHRIAAARYFGQETVQCDIYSDKTMAMELHGEEVMLTEGVLKAHGFLAREMTPLKEINRLIGDR